MRKPIPLSPKHGVNPMIPICFWCGKQKNEIVLLGKLKGDVEAPKCGLIPGDYEPCDECKKKWDMGITLIEATPIPIPNYEYQRPMGKDAYPTGNYIVMKEEAVSRIFSDDISDKLLKSRIGFLDHNTYVLLTEGLKDDKN